VIVGLEKSAAAPALDTETRLMPAGPVNAPAGPLLTVTSRAATSAPANDPTPTLDRTRIASVPPAPVDPGPTRCHTA
jgi:hypothetical protein